MSSTLFTPVDMESIKKKLQKATATTKQQQLKWKPTPGESVVRIIPYRHGPDPFNQLYFHYDIAKKSALCPKTFAKDCPICEFAEELRKVRSEDNWRSFKKISAKPRVYIPIIVRGKESEGVKFWGVGKNVYETILSLFINPDWGDMSHPTEGTDLVINWTAPNEKMIYGETKISPRRNKSLLHEDKNMIMSLLKSVPNVFDVFPEQSYEELKKLLDEHMNGSQDEANNVKVDENDLGTIAETNESEDKPEKDLDKAFDEIFN